MQFKRNVHNIFLVYSFFFLKSRKKETRAIEKEKGKMPILAAK